MFFCYCCFLTVKHGFVLFLVGGGGGENFKVRKIYSINCMFSACKQRDRYGSDI